MRQTFEHEGRELRPATAEVIASISAKGSEDARSRESGLITELVGRKEEFSGILSAWNTARSGTFVHIHITAAAGHGKTRLIADVARRLRFDGAAVVRVSGNRGSRSLPYSLASELAAALCGSLGRPGSRTIQQGPSVHSILLSAHGSTPSPTEPAVKKRCGGAHSQCGTCWKR